MISEIFESNGLTPERAAQLVGRGEAVTSQKQNNLQNLLGQWAPLTGKIPNISKLNNK
jgi:hypothetical protein